MDTPAQPLLFYQDDAMLCAHWHNLHLAVFAQALRLAHLEVVERSIPALVQRYPRGILGLSVILPHSPIAGMAVMRRCRESVERLHSHLRFYAVVIEPSGEWSVLIKATLRSAAVVARMSRGFHLYDRSEDVCPLLVPRLLATAGVKVKSPEILALLQQLRQQVLAG